MVGRIVETVRLGRGLFDADNKQSSAGFAEVVDRFNRIFASAEPLAACKIVSINNKRRSVQNSAERKQVVEYTALLLNVFSDSLVSFLNEIALIHLYGPCEFYQLM